MAVCGVGISDISSYDPAYSVWADMINRCYGGRLRYECYKGCKVSEQWLTASKFKVWFDAHFVKGWRLDKDFKVPGNKLYSEQTCLFLPHAINSLFTGGWDSYLPRGVCFHSGYYRATLKVKGRMRKFGSYSDVEKARARYIEEKTKESLRVIGEYKNELGENVYNLLIRNLEALICA